MGQIERRYTGEGDTILEPRSRAEAGLFEAGHAGQVAEGYAELAHGERVSAGLADGSLVEDVRLRDALRSLRDRSDVGGLALEAPDIVDDAAYAVECAAVGEVDLARLDRHIRELEERIGVLEARFWPRVARTFSRAVRR